MPIVRHIVAYRKSDRAIGFQGQLVYRIKEDLANFRALTVNQVVVMGRKTFEALECKPLPKRVNIVISKTLKDADGYTVFRDVEAAIRFSKEMYPSRSIWIIGGAALYNTSMRFIKEIVATEVEESDDRPFDTVYPTLPASFSKATERPLVGFDEVRQRNVELSIVVYKRI